MNKDKLMDWLKVQPSEKLIELNNQTCELFNLENHIYDNNEEFFNMFFENKVLDAVRAVCFGEYKYSDDYVKFNGYGNLQSFNNSEDFVNIHEIADCIIKYPNEFNIK
jgi:hypothetical protein